MAENLIDYLKTHKCQGFQPIPHYSVSGDFVTYYFRDERANARPIDEVLTVYLSMATNELVGCKIEGVKQILRTAGDFGVRPDDADVPLGLFLFVGASLVRDADRRRLYEELRQVAKDVTVKREEFVGAGT